MTIFYRLLFFIVTFFGFQLKGQTVLNQTLTSNIFLEKGIYFIEDKKSELTFDEIIQSNQFKHIDDKGTNFGISNSTYWLKVELLNHTSIIDYRLQIAQSCLDVVDFYFKNKDGKIELIKGGESLVFGVREFQDPNFIYSILLPKDTLSTFYFRIQSRDNFQVPLML